MSSNVKGGAPPPGPAAVFQMMNAAQVSAILCAAIDLEVFSAIASGVQSAEAIAERIRCPARSTRILLDAMTAIGLLGREGGKYVLSPLAAEHLVPGKPMYAGDVAGIIGNPIMWTGLSRLSEAVRAGGTVLSEHAETPGNRFWETFAKSSGSMAMGASAGLEGALHDFIAGRKQVRALDIAAGSGIYGYTLVQKNPNVTLTTLDWPNVVAEAKQWGERIGIDKQRVKYLEGNLFDVDYGGPYDLILLSHVYHHFDPPTCQALTKKVAAALAPGGRVVVHEFLTDGGNPAGAMFAITMLVWTRKGEAYSGEDYKKWLTEAGLKPLGIQSSEGMPTSFVMAEKT